MPGRGKQCKICGKFTLRGDGKNGYKCTECGVEALEQGERRGRGQLCPVCGRWTVFNGTCNQCDRIIKS